MKVAFFFLSPLLLFFSGFAPPSSSTLQVALDLPTSSYAQRIVQVTEPFLGAPYHLSPLGEGASSTIDQDPRFRADAFDCTTFVETAIALAHARSLAEAHQLLDAIRYQSGTVGFLTRRHFPEAEWIPELIKLGLLKDITRAVGGDDVVVENKTLSAEIWRKSSHKGLPHLPAERVPQGTFSLDVWRLPSARMHQKMIPPGTLLHVVRADFRSVPVRVSHQGIVIEKNGKRFLRHAADRMYHAVVDEELDHFFARMEKYRKWPVVGVHLTLLQENTAWRDQVLSSFDSMISQPSK